jgi:phosphatidylcholine synthase
VQNARARQGLAWGVHTFTASGAVLGAMALLAVGAGEWRQAVLLMLAALTIDAVDGFMARAVDVRRWTPRFDGRRLDDVVDFLNYVIVPVVFLLACGLLPHWAWAVPPILASAYGFSQEEAKTEDHFFLGFPSYWNVIAIYAWMLGVSPAFCAGFVTVCAIGVFVPFKYIYPTRMPVWRRTTCILAGASALVMTWAVLDPERAQSFRLTEISLLFPAWYFVLSFRYGGLHRAAPDPEGVTGT